MGTKTAMAVFFLTLSLFMNSVPVIAESSGKAYFGPLGASGCPALCEQSGDNPSNWTQYYDANQLLACRTKPKLLDFSIRTPLGSPDHPSVIRACSTFRGEYATPQTQMFACFLSGDNDIADDGFIQSLGTSSTMQVEMAWTNTTSPLIADQLVTAATEVQGVLFNETVGSSNVVIAHYGSSVVGAYVGRRISRPGVAATLVQDFIDQVVNSKGSETRMQTLMLQRCREDNDDRIDADHVVGIIGKTAPGLSSVVTVQRALKSWSEAKCAKPLEHANSGTSAVWLTQTDDVKVNLNLNLDETENDNDIKSRAVCETIQVVSGDSCGSLAEKCGVSGADFTKFNPGSSLCSSLRVGQHVCCTSGTLPDLTPKPEPDGTCASYVVQGGDWCDKIASSYGLTVEDLESFNKNTWGWSGCERLFAGIRLCLSKGDPPMPEPIANAVCGPQKPGTERPTDGTDLADLNPCPLNVCCNIWGQCGITDDFCVESSLGPPGTSEPGKNGCISNCGTDIVNNDSGPSEFISVGYFEAWNRNRDCLHMYVTDVAPPVTHIHFAFGDVNENFEVSVDAVRMQFNKFLRMTTAKRILAFGGWTASTHPSSYNIFREGVKPENRERLATNLANFIKEYNLDGIDLDWEYPGAPDLPGIPPAEPIDGPSYLELLKLIRKKLPNKSLSIAAPASYWYLKAFPIDKISEVVDYIIYMTYDLHGQWDYGNSYSSPGCPEGNCLRSHVNMTETYNSLVMVTKAGVPSNKIVVGVTSYGRSFRMTEPGCTGPNCRFTGQASGATKGRCTDEAGYVSNAEIDEIIEKNPSAKVFHDDSYSDILVYDDVQWVAYMTEDNKARRNKRWKGLNFAGVTDWAVDLQIFRAAYEPYPDDPPIDDSKDWTEFPCTHWAANDTSRHPKTRWNTLHADEAWNEVILAWKTARGKTDKAFTDFISNEFHGRDSMNCSSLLEGSNCEETHLCIESDGSGPAATLILNSFVPIRSYFMDTYNAIETARNDINSNIEAFVETFAPEIKPDPFFNILMNLLNFALAGFSAPLFNSVLRGSKFWQNNPNAADTIKDDTYAMYTFGVSSGKDAIAAKAVNLDIKGTLKDLFLSMVIGWRELVVIAAGSIFNGSDSSITTLQGLISEGKFVSTSTPDDLTRVVNRIKSMMYAYLIPVTWAVKDIAPVIIETGNSCDDVGEGVSDWVSSEDAEKAHVCLDDKLYYILSLPESYRRCQANPCAPCTFGKMKPPPGLDDLPNQKWGEISMKDIVEGSVASNKAFGNRENDKYPDGSDEDVWKIIYNFVTGNKMHKSPGVINVPVCGVQEVVDNWKKRTAGQDVDWEAFPCNAPKK